jgi:hypothetical protein
VQRFHRTLHDEFDTRRVFTNLGTAQQALDEWVADYNFQRPHQSLDDRTPAERFQVPAPREPQGRAVTGRPERAGEQWVSRRIATNGIVCIDWQQVSVGKHYGGQACDVLVTDKLLQFWLPDQLARR